MMKLIKWKTIPLTGDNLNLGVIKMKKVEKAYTVHWTIVKSRWLGFKYRKDAMQFLNELHSDKRVKSVFMVYEPFISNRF